MKGILRGICRAVPFLLLAAVVLAVSLFPRQSAAEGESVRIVRVWNVDTFEGGKGSRTAFLKRAAELAERGRTGVRYLVTSVTAEGALDALGRGELPDVLSYGGGLSAFEPHCLPLGERFAGESRALPWCRGEYYLFSLTDDFESAGDVAISVGGSNLACAAAYFAGVSGSEAESLSAYVDFLGGKYCYLLGTQRDKCRFASRGAAVYAKPLTEFCDLYQYVSVLSEEAYDDALFFVNTLRSEAVQCQLGDIGMLPAAGAAGYTTGVFMTAETSVALAQAVRAGEPRKNIENFLKTV